MTPQPTGRIERDENRRRVVLERRFSAPIQDVWAAVTESDRLARWIGTWTGQPTSGAVEFVMTAEPDSPAQRLEVSGCEPPRHLDVRFDMGDSGGWQLQLDLAETAGVTTLTFTHVDIDPAQIESIGPGWEYYLDRLSANLEGGDVAAIDFDRDYYPAMREHYR